MRKRSAPHDAAPGGGAAADIAANRRRSLGFASTKGLVERAYTNFAFDRPPPLPLSSAASAASQPQQRAHSLSKKFRRATAATTTISVSNLVEEALAQPRWKGLDNEISHHQSSARMLPASSSSSSSALHASSSLPQNANLRHHQKENSQQIPSTESMKIIHQAQQPTTKRSSPTTKHSSPLQQGTPLWSPDFSEQSSGILAPPTTASTALVTPATAPTIALPWSSSSSSAVAWTRFTGVPTKENIENARKEFMERQVKLTQRQRQLQEALGEKLTLAQALNEINEDFKCAVCLSLFKQPVALYCGHCVCKHCFEECLANKESDCPVCRRKDVISRRTLLEDTTVQKALVAFLKFQQAVLPNAVQAVLEKKTAKRLKFMSPASEVGEEGPSRPKQLCELVTQVLPFSQLVEDLADPVQSVQNLKFAAHLDKPTSNPFSNPSPSIIDENVHGMETPVVYADGGGTAHPLATLPPTLNYNATTPPTILARDLLSNELTLEPAQRESLATPLAVDNAQKNTPPTVLVTSAAATSEQSVSDADVDANGRKTLNLNPLTALLTVTSPSGHSVMNRVVDPVVRALEFVESQSPTSANVPLNTEQEEELISRTNSLPTRQTSSAPVEETDLRSIRLSLPLVFPLEANPGGHENMQQQKSLQQESPRNVETPRKLNVTEDSSSESLPREEHLHVKLKQQKFLVETAKEESTHEKHNEELFQSNSKPFLASSSTLTNNTPRKIGKKVITSTTKRRHVAILPSSAITATSQASAAVIPSPPPLVNQILPQNVTSSSSSSSSSVITATAAVSSETHALNAEPPKKDPFRVKAVVRVAARTGPNENKEGGVAIITAKNRDDTVDVKYTVSGLREKHISLDLLTPEVLPKSTSRNARRGDLSGKDDSLPPAKRTRLRGNHSQLSQYPSSAAAASSASSPPPTNLQRRPPPPPLPPALPLPAHKRGRVLRSRSSIGGESSATALDDIDEDSTSRMKSNATTPVSPASVAAAGSSEQSTLTTENHAHLVIATSNVHRTCELSKKVNMAVATLPNAQRCPEEADPWIPTHLVMDPEGDRTCLVAKRTLKFLHAMSLGLWIVRGDWVRDSLEKKAWLDEIHYEFVSDRASTDRGWEVGGPKRAREIITKSKNTGDASHLVFAGLSICFAGRFRSDLVAELGVIISNCGARFSRWTSVDEALDQEATHIIFNEEPNTHEDRALFVKARSVQKTRLVKVLLKEWIFGCVGTYSLVKEDSFVVKGG